MNIDNEHKIKKFRPVETQDVDFPIIRVPQSIHTEKGTITSDDDCMEKIINGKAVFAHGAQENNTYYFKEAL